MCAREELIRETLAYIEKSLDNVADLDVVWENAEVVEVLEDVRSLLVTGEINPGSFEKAQAPTDEERHWSDAAASAYPGDEYDNADLRTAFGRGVKWERRRPAQTEPTDAQDASCPPKPKRRKPEPMSTTMIVSLGRAIQKTASRHPNQ